MRVSSTFGTFILEDGRGKVTLDIMKAYDHVRYVLNDIRGTKGTNNCDVPSPVYEKEIKLNRDNPFYFLLAKG